MATREGRLWSEAVLDKIRECAENDMSMPRCYEYLTARGVLDWGPAFATFKAIVQRNGIKFHSTRAKYLGMLSSVTITNLTDAAKKRGIKWHQLAVDLLTIIAKDNLVDSILDD